jgi:hypothetical protein
MPVIVITDIDMGFDSIHRNLGGLKGAKVEAGLFTEEEASKGARAEFGTTRTKPRPWMSVAADLGEARIMASAEGAVERVAGGASVASALEPVGQVMVDMLGNVIRTQKVGGPALADSTIERKGHSVNLVDTSNMVRALDHKVTQ